MTWAEAIPVWVTIGLALAGMLFVRRNGGGGALAELELANRVLGNRVKELEDKNKALTAQVATLTSRTDVSAAVTPVLEALRLHEDRAAIRSDKTLTVLDLIAARLGPEAEAA